MNKIIFILFFFIFVPTKADELNQYFHVGKMQSYNNNFTLYFKTRENAIIAKGEYQNYLNDYPQDLYFYDHHTKIDYPLISYEWFPKSVKKLSKDYKYPLFPEDFAYYLLNDNDTLILVSATKNFYQNLSFSIKEKKLTNAKFNGKLDFIVSSFAKNCGHKDLNTSFKCNFYKPLISKNLITSFE
jgi:hypothetical protein